MELLFHSISELCLIAPNFYVSVLGTINPFNLLSFKGFAFFTKHIQSAFRGSAAKVG